MTPLLLKLLFTLMPKRGAGAAAAAGAQGVQPGAGDAGQSAAQAAHGLLGESDSAERVVRGQEFSGADIQMSFPLEAASARGGLEDGHPGASRSSSAFTPRPAYARALEKAAVPGRPVISGSSRQLDQRQQPRVRQRRAAMSDAGEIGLRHREGEKGPAGSSGGSASRGPSARRRARSGTGRLPPMNRRSPPLRRNSGSVARDIAS